MFKSKKILAFIPARAGSKGIKNKNIIDLAGKPLIQWTIEAALGCPYIDRTIVSTDGPQIADVARKCGADVPFMRPAEFAADHSPAEDALKHCIEWIKTNEKISYDFVIVLQPTSPLRTKEHVSHAIEQYFKNKKSEQDTLVSVFQAPRKMAWLMKIVDSGYIVNCFPIAKNKRLRQLAPACYLPNGMIYFGPVSVMLKQGCYSKRTIPFIMDEDISVDIDAPEDLKRAQDIYQQKVSAERIRA